MPRDLFADIRRRLNPSSDKELPDRNRATRSENGRQVEEEPQIIAVLDWELSTIGHPLGDFTYHLMAWQTPEIGIGSSGLLGKDLKALGIPTEDEYVATYCDRTNRPGGIPNRDFYAAYNFSVSLRFCKVSRVVFAMARPQARMPNGPPMRLLRWLKWPGRMRRVRAQFSTKKIAVVGRSVTVP